VDLWRKGFAAPLVHSWFLTFILALLAIMAMTRFALIRGYKVLAFSVPCHL